MFPILFELGPFTIYSVWICAILGLMLGTLLFLKRAKYNRLDINILLEHSLSLMVGTLVLSRIAFTLSNWGYFGVFKWSIFFKQLFFFWQPGYSFWGAALGFSLIFAYHLRKSEQNSLDWLQVMFIPVLVGIMIGNVGQFLDGQAYGHETIFPWGVIFTNTNVKYTVPIHPTQLYSILLIALILFSKKWVAQKWPLLTDEKEWTLFAIAAFSLGRFLMEFLRGDDIAHWGFVRIGHIGSLLIFVPLAVFLYKRWRKGDSLAH